MTSGFVLFEGLLWITPQYCLSILNIIKSEDIFLQILEVCPEVKVISSKFHQNRLSQLITEKEI